MPLIREIAPASAADWLQPGREVRLDLLDNQDITLAVESVEPTATGGRVKTADARPS